MKPGFKTYLYSRRSYGKRERELTADLVFYSAALGKDILVPSGFVYDGPSSPVIWGGDGEASSAIHDYMYSMPDFYTRAEADAVLRECLAVEGMGFFRRNWWWTGVRLIGWIYYGDRKDANRHYDGPESGADRVRPDSQADGGA